MDMLLSQQEIEALTEYTKPALQKKQLQKMGIPFKAGRTGKPKVLRSVLIGKLSGNSVSNSVDEPNFGAIGNS